LANFARKRVAAGASRCGHLQGAREGASAAHHRLIIMRGTVGELDRMHGGAAAQYARRSTSTQCSGVNMTTEHVVLSLIMVVEAR